MKPTLNEQLARMQKLAGIIKENQQSIKEYGFDPFSFGNTSTPSTPKASFEDKWKSVPAANKELLKKSTGKEPIEIMASSKGMNFVITKGPDGKFYRYEYIQAEKPGEPMGPFNNAEEAKKLKENTTYTNEGEGAYKDPKVSFGKFKNVEYYKVDNELYLVVTNSDNFKEIENSMDFGDRDYLKDKEKSFLNNTVDKLADEMSNYLTSIGVKNEVGDSPIGYGQEIDNLIVVIDPNDLSKLNNT